MPSERQWQSVELAIGDDLDAALSRPGPPRELVARFLQWQIRTGALICCVRAGRWPEIVVEAQPHLSRLAASGARGFELIVASATSAVQIREFLGAWGYVYSGNDDALAAPGGDRYEAALTLAMTLDAAALCVFAHDANPIWIMSSNYR